jgi:hypothetical protein
MCGDPFSDREAPGVEARVAASSHKQLLSSWPDPSALPALFITSVFFLILLIIFIPLPLLPLFLLVLYWYRHHSLRNIIASLRIATPREQQASNQVLCRQIINVSFLLCDPIHIQERWYPSSSI